MRGDHLVRSSRKTPGFFSDDALPDGRSPRQQGSCALNWKMPHNRAVRRVQWRARRYYSSFCDIHGRSSCPTLPANSSNPQGFEKEHRNGGGREFPNRMSYRSGKIVARPERFELPTSWFVARRSIQLSYGRRGAANINTCNQRRQFPRFRTRTTHAIAHTHVNIGGEGGIRTLDGLLTHTPLAGARLRPLGHLSGLAPGHSRSAG